MNKTEKLICVLLGLALVGYFMWNANNRPQPAATATSETINTVRSGTKETSRSSRLSTLKTAGSSDRTKRRVLELPSCFNLSRAKLIALPVERGATSLLINLTLSLSESE